MATSIRTIATAQGEARLFIDSAADPRAVLVLGHGAGGSTTSIDLEVLARRLPERGTTVVRFEQPWRTAGRRTGVPAPRLDDAWLSALGWLSRQEWAQLPLFTGGRSTGARVACRTVEVVRPLGVVCLAFPLHPPGRPDRSRAAELLAPSVPRLVLQGSKDAFGSAHQVSAVVAGRADGARSGGLDKRFDVSVVELAGADHGFRTPASGPLPPADLRAAVVDAVAAFIDRTLAGISHP